MNRIMRAAGLGLALAMAGIAARAQDIANAPHRTDLTQLNLSAEGQVQAVPDKATITLGVQAKGVTAAQAMGDDAARMTAVIAALGKAGLAERDIATSDLSLNPQYDYQAGQTPKLTGYLASNTVTLTVDALARLGPTVDAAVSAGADQVNGISFGLKDPKSVEDQARKAAVVALRDKADLYAAATGLRVTRLAVLSEGGGFEPSPVRPLMMMKRGSAEAATPISPGELTVRITVNATYELAR